MRDAEDRVSVSKPVPPPELLDPREPLPEVQPSRTGFKASLNTSVNKLLNKKAAVVQEVPDPDVARVWFRSSRFVAESFIFRNQALVVSILF